MHASLFHFGRLLQHRSARFAGSHSIFHQQRGQHCPRVPLTYVYSFSDVLHIREKRLEK